MGDIFVSNNVVKKTLMILFKLYTRRDKTGTI